MLSDESPPTVRVLLDAVSPATREKRPVSRKRLAHLPPTSSHSRSARPGEFSNCVKDRTIDLPIISEKRPIQLQRAKYILVGESFVPRLRACIDWAATLLGRRWEIGAKQIPQERIEYAAR